ncbi:MAG: hypothetical protein AAGL90_07170 [Pseudomonadota bacterium]
MKKAQMAPRTLRFRPDYLLYFAVLYPFVLMGVCLSKAMGKRYTDDRKYKRNIFFETSSNLHAVLPWVYYS